MKERKNLENLFQEKFQNFEPLPPENVWDGIELKLKEKKKKRRVIPFWWKATGIAASLIIGLYILNTFYTNNLNENSVVNEEVKSEEGNNKGKSGTNSKLNINPKDNEGTIAIDNNNSKSLEDEKFKINEKNEQIVNNKGLNNLEKNSKKSNISNQFQNKLVKSTTQDKTETKFVSNNGYAVVNNNINSNNSLEDKANQDIKNLSSKQITNKENTGFEKNNLITNSVLKSTENIVNENKKNKILNSENTIFKNSINIEKSIANKENEVIIAEEIKKIDSTKIAIVEPNALEELLKEKEKKTIAEQKLNRWQVSTNVAPIYFSSSSNGSPLDSKFENNSKTFNTSLSYGLGVNYAVSKKLKIRTGINRLSVDYNTNDVVFSQNNNASRIEHIKTNTQGSVLQLESRLSAPTMPEINGNGFVTKKFDSKLNQKFGYLEVPVEMSYAFLNKKFGIDLIGGVSTLILNQNEVSIVSSGLNMNIGEADNLNDIHFSTNIGLGFKYSFLKRFDARIEPVFKYQMNTFSNDAGNFKPYVFGVYSGISYTF